VTAFLPFFLEKKRKKNERGKHKEEKENQINTEAQNIFLYVPQSLFLSQNKNEKSNRDYLSNISDLFFTIGSLFLTFLTFVSCNSYFFLNLNCRYKLHMKSSDAKASKCQRQL